MDTNRTGLADWPTLNSEKLCDSPWLSVSREKIATPSRPNGVEWMVIRRSVAAVVAPRTREGNYVLIRQERIPVKREIWEFPAGQVEGAVTPETILATATRELGEEAALACRSPLIPLGMYFSSPGFTDECCHLFLADGVESEPGLQQHDENEAIHGVRSFTPEDLLQAVADGKICDANTLACFARLQARGIF